MYNIHANETKLIQLQLLFLFALFFLLCLGIPTPEETDDHHFLIIIITVLQLEVLLAIAVTIAITQLCRQGVQHCFHKALGRRRTQRMRKESLKLSRNRGTRIHTELNAPTVEMTQDASVANGGHYKVPIVPVPPKPVHVCAEQQANDVGRNKNGGSDIASRPSMTAVLNELRINERHLSGTAAEYI